MNRETLRNAALLGMFLASGCSALIYEIVWFQQLSLVLGASAVSLAILLASFMGGMCLGSLGHSRCVPQKQHPLWVYGVLELLIAVCGLATLWLFPIVSRVYCSMSLAGSNDLVARAIVAVLLLLPPTAMMGATLPTVSRWVQSTRSGMAWLGWFYAANTFGAVVGSLLAGMYLLRRFDVYVATYVAATINVSVALICFRLVRVRPRSEMDADHYFDQSNKSKIQHVPEVTSVIRPGYFGVIHLVIGLCGFTALGAEVIWTRYLSLLLGPTVYTFSIIVAVFLFGLGVGSSLGAAIGRRVRSPRLALAVTQLLLLAAIPYAAYAIIHVVPNWLALRGSEEQFTVRVLRDIVRVTIAILPATCLWGASFPLAVAVMAGTGRDPSRLVGGLYAANTFGAIIGAVGTSLFAIPYGGQFVQQLLTLSSGLSGMLILGTMTWRHWRSARQFRFVSAGVKPASLGIASLVVALVGSLFACRHVPTIPGSLLAAGRFMYQEDPLSIYLYVAEGLDSPIVVSETFDGVRSFHVAGKIEASTLDRDVRTQRLLGHLPAMAHPLPKKVLVVGCGSGMTAGSFLLHPSITEIVICEMEKCVIEASRDNFADYNYGVLRDPRTRIVHDDARHFLATTRESFDIITTDPIHPWVKGAATLYTAEFFQLCKSHLNHDGIVTLWVPLYESNEATVKCEMATFLQAFPQSTIWSGQSFQVGYDVVVVGAIADVPLDLAKTVNKMTLNKSLERSFDEVGLGTTITLLDCFAARGHQLKPWLRGAEINRDSNLRLQYMAGSSFDHAMEQHIFESMTETPKPQGN